MQQEIANYLASLEFSVKEEQVEQIAEYASQLWQTNERVNLTRHVDIDSFLTRDVRDSIALCPHLKQQESVLDIGSGGGIPGILVAILRPDIKVSLAESVGKKAQALNEFVDALNLQVSVFHSRAEQVVSSNKFNTLTVRAVGSVSKLADLFHGKWRRFDRLLALKGRNWSNEIDEAGDIIKRQKLVAAKIDEYSSHEGTSTSVIVELKRTR